MVAFHLSVSGCPGESLFGILACLIYLLGLGANPCLRADISLAVLVGAEEPTDC